MTEATGGSVFFPKEVAEVDRIAHQVARDIRNQYAIAYHSPQASVGGYHTVKVEAHA